MINYFTSFKSNLDKIKIPKIFDYPFSYEPQKIAKIATIELQKYIIDKLSWDHKANQKEKKTGKMFGVLVVKDKNNNLGYLKGFSGMLNGKQEILGFVPPIYNRLKKNNFYKIDEEEINVLNNLIADKKKSEKDILTLKRIRKNKSLELQNKLFKKYNFIDSQNNSKNIIDIFKKYSNTIPPSGAGDCVAPKLLQFAFINKLKPICMAEFWWGKSPPLKIRKHGYFYPACKSKCKPILTFMLNNIKMNKNPFLENKNKSKKIKFIFEDQNIIIIDKPHDFLSVPGKNIKDSVETRIREKYLIFKDPIIVHRLDMATSGLMIIAKNKEIHKKLQDQFLKKQIKKKYTAILDGEIKVKEGYINLPIRVDLDNRPSQMVCYEHGKSARTKFKVIDISNKKTKINLYPITGRTHQLRVHMSHHKGLNTSIFGDVIYGKKADRLYLHAEKLIFKHPSTKKKLEFTSICPF